MKNNYQRISWYCMHIRILAQQSFQDPLGPFGSVCQVSRDQQGWRVQPPHNCHGLLSCDNHQPGQIDVEVMIETLKSGYMSFSS